MTFSEIFLKETIEIASAIDTLALEQMAQRLAEVREREGRLFLLGVGGSAASASHAVNDFRKLCGFEAYAPTDNVSELTARTNDEGWDTVFAEWLLGSRLGKKDALLIFSVGGGDASRGISANLVKAVDLAKSVKAEIFSLVGRDGGYAKKEGDLTVLVPVKNPDRITPHTEAFHGVLWHLLVSHPKLKLNPAKWESSAK